MSKNRNRQKSAAYKPVECQSLQDGQSLRDEVNGGNNIPPSPVRPINPYTIVGACRVSRSGLSLSIKLFANNLVEGSQPRYLTIQKSDIIALFTDTNELTVASVKEYHNVEPIEQNKQKSITNIGG